MTVIDQGKTEMYRAKFEAIRAENLKPRQPLPLALYSDGGVIGRNPSPVGATWAWCHVGEHGGQVAGDFGIIRPEDVGLPAVSNNVSEYMALLKGFEALPPGWCGNVYTDSFVTLCRFRGFRRAKTNGLPAELVARCRAVMSRMGRLNFTLLKGHPTREDLQRGRTSKGEPVSVHNQWCDERCNEAAARFRFMGR